MAGGRLRRPCKLQHGISLNQTSVEPVEPVAQSISFGVKSVSRLYIKGAANSRQQRLRPMQFSLQSFFCCPSTFNAFAETLGTRKISPGAIRILAYLHDNLYSATFQQFQPLLHRTLPRVPLVSVNGIATHLHSLAGR